MHNLVKRDLETLDILPREQHSKKYYDDWWGKGHSDWHYIEDYGPSIIARRVIKKFENKTFDQAFSYYCTLVPKYQQKFFMQEFDRDSLYWRDSYKLVDGIIKKFPKTQKKTYTFYSDDYTHCYKHKVTGREISEKEYWSGRIPKDPKRIYSDHIRINREDFDIKVLTGWTKTFESKEDPRYLRLLREQQKRRAIKYKKEQKERANKTYCFMTKDELEKKKLAETDEATRDRHGFDKTTFMGIEYHGQKRKRKEL